MRLFIASLVSNLSFKSSGNELSMNVSRPSKGYSRVISVDVELPSKSDVSLGVVEPQKIFGKDMHGKFLGFILVPETLLGYS